MPKERKQITGDEAMYLYKALDKKVMESLIASKLLPLEAITHSSLESKIISLRQVENYIKKQSSCQKKGKRN